MDVSLEAHGMSQPCAVIAGLIWKELCSFFLLEGGGEPEWDCGAAKPSGKGLVAQPDITAARRLP